MRITQGITLASAVASFVAILALGVWMALSDIPSFRGAETNVIFTIQKALAGERLYTDPSDIPFDIAQYSPVYYAICILICDVVGVGPAEAETITTIARMVSTTASILTCVAIFLLLKTLRVEGVYGVICCSFWLVASAPWGFLARPDSTMSLFLMSSILALLAGYPEGQRRYPLLILSVLLGFLAVGAKQNGAQSFLIILSASLVLRDWKGIAVIATTLLIAGLLSAAAAEAVFGPAIWDNLVGGVRNGVDVRVAVRKVFVPFAVYFSIPCIASLVAASAAARDDRDVVLRVALLVAFGFAVATSFKIGSALNYFNDCLALAGIVIVRRASREPLRRREGGVIGASASLLSRAAIGYFVFFAPLCTIHRIHGYWYSYLEAGRLLQPAAALQFRALDAAASRASEILGDGDGYVLCYSEGLDNKLPARSIIPQIEVAQLSHQQGALDFSRLRDYINEGRVPLIVMPRGGRPGKLVGIDLQGYQLISEAGDCSFFAREGETIGPGSARSRWVAGPGRPGHSRSGPPAADPPGGPERQRPPFLIDQGYRAERAATDPGGSGESATPGGEHRLDRVR